MNRLRLRHNDVWRWRGAFAMAMLCALCLGTTTTPAAAASPIAAAPVCRDVTVPVTLALLLPGTIHGTLCRPATGTANPTAQLLLPGATYNASYWDGEGVAAASYVGVATAAGSITLAIDRIGTGGSSAALSATVTAVTEASVIHQVITALHKGSIDGQPHSQVALIGHSLGSMESLIEASTYHDVAELVLTGYAHLPSVPVAVSTFLTGLRPAFLEGFPGRDPAWLATIPGTRASLFDAAKVSASLWMPVLEVDGGQDGFFCGPLTAGCPTAAALYTREAPTFPNASLATVVLPDAGHDVSLARDGDQAATAIQSWLATAAAGHATRGPLPGGG